MIDPLAIVIPASAALGSICTYIWHYPVAVTAKRRLQRAFELYAADSLLIAQLRGAIRLRDMAIDELERERALHLKHRRAHLAAIARSGGKACQVKRRKAREANYSPEALAFRKAAAALAEQRRINSLGSHQGAGKVDALAIPAAFPATHPCPGIIPQPTVAAAAHQPAHMRESVNVCPSQQGVFMLATNVGSATPNLN